MKAHLIIVFNHQYNENISKLERLYRAKFPDMKYLVPFYKGDNPDVVAVYENSYQYHGYFAQAASRIKLDGASHYVFVADDLLLNPCLTSSTMADFFGLDDRTSFLPGFISLHDQSTHWPRVPMAMRFFDQAAGFEYEKYLPTSKVARAAFARHGIPLRDIPGQLLVPPLRFPSLPRNLLGGCASLLRFVKHGFRVARLRRTNRPLPYPLAGAWSDFVVVAAPSLEKFCDYCGVLAAMNVFVELALPLALILAADTLRTEAHDGSVMKGNYLWNPAEVMAFEKEYGQNLNSLAHRFPAGTSFVHPIKLSRWHDA